MDRFERNECEATRAKLKEILGIEGDSGLNNAELASRVLDHVRRLEQELMPECPDCDGTGGFASPCGGPDEECDRCGGSGRIEP